MIILSTGPATQRQIALIARIDAMPRRANFLSDLLLDHRRGKQLTLGQMAKADEIINQGTKK